MIIELIETAFTPVNAVLTTLLGLMLLYWLVVLIGAIDTDFLDIDLDIDADVDLDVDVDTDVDTGSDIHGGSFVIEVLKFFNFGKIPLMFLLSILILCMWLISVNITHLFNNSTFISLIILVPNLILSLFVTKIVSYPFAKFFETIPQKGEASVDYLGRVCTIILPPKGESLGQAEVRAQENAMTITVKLKDPTSDIPKGAKGLIVEQSPEKNYYLITKHEEI